MRFVALIFLALVLCPKDSMPGDVIPVPGSGGVTANSCAANNFAKGINASGILSCAVPSGGGGSGTVTSVGLSVPATSILGVTGSPVTTSGTLGLTTTGTSGGVPYFSSTSALSSSAALANHGVILGGGAGAAPASLAPNSSNAFPLVSGGSSANPSWSLLSVAGGGTGTNSLTANRILLGNGTSGITVLGAGTTTQLLHGNASGPPTFGNLSASDFPAGMYVPLANGGAGQSNLESPLNLSAGGTPSSPWNDFPLASYSSFIVTSLTPSGYTISGFLHPAGNGQIVTWKNLGSNTLTFGGSGSSSSNGVCPRTGTYFQLPYNASVTFQYELSNACWSNITPGEVDYGNYPGTVSSSDVSYWNGKQNPISFPTVNSVLFGSAQGDSNYLYWDDTNHYLGIALASVAPTSSLEIGASTPISPQTPTGGSSGVYNISNAFNAPSSISGPTWDTANSGYGPANNTNYCYTLYSTMCPLGTNVAPCYGTASSSYCNTDPNDGSYGSMDTFYMDGIGTQGSVIQQTSPSSVAEFVGFTGSNTFVDNNDMTNTGNIPNSAASSGILATGSSALNASINVYAALLIGGTYVYSPTPLTLTTTDPGDFSYDVGYFSWSSVASAAYYRIQFGAGTCDVTGTNFVFDANTTCGGPNTFTPNSVTPPTLQVDSGVSAFSGGVQLNTSTTQPTCDASIRGLMWNIENSGATPDTFQICQYAGIGGYAWVTH